LKGRTVQRSRGLIFVGLLAVALLSSLLLTACGGGKRGGGKRLPSIVICRGASVTPVFATGSYVGGFGCNNPADVGRAPIARPRSLVCLADLSGVNGKTVGTQVFYGRRLIEHDTYYPTDATTSASIAISPAVVTPSASRLPFGRFTCRFLINGKVIHARTVTVG
jgi:hypothetical protein